MKEAAHAHQAKVNDVVLDLWSGGLRERDGRTRRPGAMFALLRTGP
jgi:hypothetical protein